MQPENKPPAGRQPDTGNPPAPSPLQKAPGAARWSLLDLILIPLLAALLFAVQVALSFLPNIELVSLLVIVFALVLRGKVFPVIYLFALLEGLLYGFSVWWISYLYVWSILALLAFLFRRMRSPLGWGILSGLFGLFFGCLCEIPWVFIIGPQAALAAIASGLLFDVIHCAGNFAAALLLAMPLTRALEKLSLRYGSTAGRRSAANRP